MGVGLLSEILVMELIESLAGFFKLRLIYNQSLYNFLSEVTSFFPKEGMSSFY